MKCQHVTLLLLLTIEENASGEGIYFLAYEQALNSWGLSHVMMMIY